MATFLKNSRIFEDMKMFRQRYIRKMMILFTGITFLNMSFFLAEVTALKLNKSEKMIENIARLISGAGFEEERDACGESSEGGGGYSFFKEVDLHSLLISDHYNSLYLIAQKRNGLLDDPSGCSGYSETFSPPPEA
jgi:hypothetical protein